MDSFPQTFRREHFALCRASARRAASRPAVDVARRLSKVALSVNDRALPRTSSGRLVIVKGCRARRGRLTAENTLPIWLVTEQRQRARFRFDTFSSSRVRWDAYRLVGLRGWMRSPSWRANFGRQAKCASGQPWTRCTQRHEGAASHVFARVATRFVVEGGVRRENAVG